MMVSPISVCGSFTPAPDPVVVGALTQLVAQARARVTGSHPRMLVELATFFRVGFPAAVWRARWWVLGAAVGFVVVAAAVGAWVAGNPQVQAALGTPAEIRQLVEQDFADYYSSDAAGGFAARVWTNNAWVSALVLIAGARSSVELQLESLGTNLLIVSPSREQADARLARERRPEPGILLVDLVRVMRLDALQPFPGQRGGHLEALLDAALAPVPLVKAAARRRKIPDSGP